MRIGWILNERWLEDTATGLYSSIASYRYRAIIPGGELSRRGHTAAVMGLIAGPESYDRGRQFVEGVDVVVFGKMFEATVLLPSLLAAAKEAGKRVVVDICDDFLEKSFADLYRDVLPAADAVSTSSPFLGGRIEEMTGRRATVIADPYEGARGTPRWEPRGKLEAAWFGNVINLTGLDLALQGFLAARVPMHLVVVTDISPIARAWERFRRPDLAPTIELDVRQWSVEATARALRDCDVALLPFDRGLDYYLSKGPGRMVEALWAGRFVTAHPLPAYEEFRDWAWIGDDIVEGLAWAHEHGSEITGQVAQAQEHIAKCYSPAAVATAWEAFLTGVCAGR